MVVSRGVDDFQLLPCMKVSNRRGLCIDALNRKLKSATSNRSFYSCFVVDAESTPSGVVMTYQ